jgi:hypothetical protein
VEKKKTKKLEGIEGGMKREKKKTASVRKGKNRNMTAKL